MKKAIKKTKQKQSNRKSIVFMVDIFGNSMASSTAGLGMIFIWIYLGADVIPAMLIGGIVSAILGRVLIHTTIIDNKMKLDED